MLRICVFQDGIVEQLQCRFQQNQIYTYIGDILVAVNPFIDLGLYTDAVSGSSSSCSAFKYRKQSLQESYFKE
jgi:myosin heavy subunit